MSNGRRLPWSSIGVGVGLAAAAGGLLWYMQRSSRPGAATTPTWGDQPGLPSGPPPPVTKPGVVTIGVNGTDVTLNGRPASADQAVEAAKAQSGVVEFDLYHADKGLWQSIKDRLDKAAVKWNIVSVVSIGKVVRSAAGGRGTYN